MADNNKPKIDTTSPVDEVLDTTGLLLDFLAHWKWFVLSAVAFLIGAYFHIATIVPMYQVNASIYLNNSESQAKNAVAMDPYNPLVAMKNYIDETELEILRSRNNVIDIVDSLNMAYSYWRAGNLRDIPLYGNNAVSARLDSVSLSNLGAQIALTVENGSEKEKFNVTSTTWVNGAEDKQEFENVTLPCDIELSQGTVTLERVKHIPALTGTEKIYIRNPRGVAGALSGALNIAFAEKSPTIVRIGYTTPVIQQGVDVINTLIDLYNRQIIEDKNRSAIQTEAFILERLVMINDELRDVEQRLLEYRQAHNISDLQQQVSSSLNTKNSTESQLAEVEAQRQIINSIENMVSKADAYDALPAVSSDAALNAIIEAYNKKVNQLNRMLESSTSDNPVVRSLQDELTRDKSRLLQSINSVKNNLNVRKGSIQAIEGRSAGQLAALPPVDKGLQEIFREQQVKVNIYTFLLQRREEIALQKTLATNTARFIDNPAGSPAPVSPRKSIIFAAAFILGLAIPGVIIFVKRTLFPVFANKEELERVTKVPIIGEICSDPRQGKDNEKTDFVISENNSSAIAELFRLLRNNISFTRDGKKNKVILVTSSISGEGKTFVASNLAMTYALMGKKTIVLGLDLRRPMLSKRMGFNNRKGITTYLSGQTDNIEGIIQKTNENGNLFIIPAGPVPPNPNELLMSQRMENLMEQLRSEFDYIIIDSAPIGVISDTFLLTRYSDIQLYVTRASYTSKHNLKLINQAISNGQFTNAYIVINGVDMNSSAYVYSRYGYYGKYGRKSSSVYGYGYAKKSAEETASDSKK